MQQTECAGKLAHHGNATAKGERSETVDLMDSGQVTFKPAGSIKMASYRGQDDDCVEQLSLKPTVTRIIVRHGR